MNCSECNTPMYQASNGLFECRNFDCPPGTAKRHKDSWALVEKYKESLRQRPASDFTVEEIGMLLKRDNSNDKDGPRMKAIAKRLGIDAAGERT